MWWGVACLFIPGTLLLFIFLHWDVAKAPFFYNLAGVGIMFVPFFVIGSVGQEPPDTSPERLQEFLVEFNDGLPMPVGPDMEWTEVTLDDQVFVMHYQMVGVSAGQISFSVEETVSPNMIDRLCGTPILAAFLDEGIAFRTELTGTHGGWIGSVEVTADDCPL